MSTAVIQFLTERKEAYLKDKLKGHLSDEQQAVIHQEASDKFSLTTWLPDAAKRAGQLSMVSHPSKFSHPSAKSSNVIALAEQRNDGYVRTGNVKYDLDVFGNAAAMDVYKFLSLAIEDGRSVLAHLEQDTVEIQKTFALSTASYPDLRAGLLSIKQADEAQKRKTDRLIKQVYFPVAADTKSYHLLSVLTPSGVLSRLKSTIDVMRFSDETKAAKEARKNGKVHETGYDDIFNLTVTAYGGTQPQNVSVLNSKNAGRAYLLSSTPPTLIKRDIRLPKKDFFKESLYARNFSDSFQSLHKLMKADVNNINIREAIANIIRFVIDGVLRQAFAIRVHDSSKGGGWSGAEYYQSLPLAQRIWLDEAHRNQRAEDGEWVDVVAHDCALWFINSYQYVLKTEHIKTADAELLHIEDFAREIIVADKEYFV